MGLVDEIVFCWRREREGHNGVVQLDRIAAGASSKLYAPHVPSHGRLHRSICPCLYFDTVPLELFQGRGRTVRALNKRETPA